MELNQKDFHTIIEHYFPISKEWQITPIGLGLINKTYKITNNQNSYLLQQVNTKVFKNPESISFNINLLSSHLKQKEYAYEIVEVLSTQDNKTTVNYKSNVWRILTYVKNTTTITSTENVQQVKKAALAFSAFYSATSDFNLEKLKTAIPDFTNFLERLNHFDKAVEAALPTKLELAQNEILACKEQLHLVHKYVEIEHTLPKRLIHSDPKISNVLFDKNKQDVKAIIDLDTLMSGCILYDYGDMIRSFSNRYPEDELGAHSFSKANYIAIRDSFLHHLSDILTSEEKKHIDLAAQTLILVQSIRFLTDFLEGDTYYKCSYPFQNLNRTKNQLQLLEGLKKYLKKASCIILTYFS